jgi:hypothetical protein
MLDFYIIQDEQNKPDWPEQIELEYAGRLDEKVFKSLKMTGFIEAEFDYYADFRWNKTFVQQKYEAIKLQRSNFKAKELVNDTDLTEFFNLIGKAVKLNSGLIAYCD